jgi:hypothetical protein
LIQPACPKGLTAANDCTVWAADFEMPASNLFLFISADAAKEKKKREKMPLPAGVSKSAAHTLMNFN